jgi:hypothetical protein
MCIILIDKSRSASGVALPFSIVSRPGYGKNMIDKTGSIWFYAATRTM